MSNDDHRSTRRDRRIPAPTEAATLASLVASLALAGYWLPALSAVAPVLRRPLGVEDRTETGLGFALTFDDGPHEHATPAVLEILAQARAPATFFLVGEQVRRSPALVGELLAAGHDVGIHCQRHRNLLRLSPRQVHEDLGAAAASIEDLSGQRLALYRPPYGILNAAALRFARARGWRTVLWSHWGRDWQARATAQSIASRLTAGAAAGSVGLLHDSDRYGARDSWRQTVAALPLVLEALSRGGLEPTKL
jgi:peptidoglycan/xylan/chitin deacetylase (PgdA/CDA1 family)